MADCALEEIRRTESWSNLKPCQYQYMLQRHEDLWEYIKNFILDSDIDSILEVGCGLFPLAKSWVSRYTAIDLNENADAIHEDFTKMDISELPEHDLLLACGVIEHCNGYRSFLEQVKILNFKHSLITFFHGLGRDVDRIRRAKQKVYFNRYSRKMLTDCLDELGLKFHLIDLSPIDDVLVIMQEGERWKLV